MFVRFVTQKKDENSHSLQGIFHAAAFVRDSGNLENYEEDWLEQELDWLNMHLNCPYCLRLHG